MNVVIGDGQDSAVVEQRQDHDHDGRQGIKIENQDRKRHEYQHPQRLGDAIDRVAVHPLKDFPALLDRLDDHRQTGRHQHDRRRCACGVGCTRHRDAAVRLLQGGSIVDPIARHTHDVTALLQHIHDMKLVFGQDLGEAVGVFDELRRAARSRDASCRRSRWHPGCCCPCPVSWPFPAIANWSPVTILIFTPIWLASAMVTLASSRGGSKKGRTPRNCHGFCASCRATRTSENRAPRTLQSPSRQRPLPARHWRTTPGSPAARPWRL